MDPAVTIRLYDAADAERLTDLLHAAYAELGARGLNFTAVDQSVATTAHRAGAGRCWIAERGHLVVATLTMSLPPSGELRSMTAEARAPRRAWLNQMAVDPTLRGTGLARHLWQLGRQWAADAGATSIGVDTAAPATHLVDIYRRWGFEHRVVVHWDGKTYDSVVMVRDPTLDD